MKQMEQTKKLSTLAEQYTKMADEEYDGLECITRYHTNTNVQGLKIIDASFIKTPYCEESPSHTKGGKNHFGLIIACDGYSMKEGLLEFWTMIVKENVKVITSFNESFSPNGAWYQVFEYFPTENEV